MREIKFRAWDNKEKKMVYDVQNLYDGNLDHFFQATSFGELLNPPRSGFGDDVIIEQYTGLKDKNGVEIYEGDIAIISEEKPISGEVKFYNGCFFIMENVKDWNTFHPIVNLFSAEIEVIGNIHETATDCHRFSNDNNKEKQKVTGREGGI